MQRLLFLMLLTGLVCGIAPIQAHAQCSFSDDFSSPTLWTQVGDEVVIANGHLEFQNGSPDGQQRRQFRDLGNAMSAANVWTAECEFHPVSVGSLQSNPFVGHNVIGLTETSNEPFNDCPDVPCASLPPGTQDAVVCNFGATNPADGNTFFKLVVRDGSVETQSAAIIANDLDTTYYISIIRDNADNVTLAVYSDASRTMHLPGSPVVISVPATVTSLRYLQHGSLARGDDRRQLTGWVDNVCIYLNGTGIEEAANDHRFQVFPTPASSQLNYRIDAAATGYIQLYDVQGRMVLRQAVSNGAGTLPLTGLSGGLYVARFVSPTLNAQRLIIVE